MPRWRTHESFLKTILPNIDAKTSRRVNRALDSPSLAQQMMSKKLGTDKYVMPGLNMYPHRRATHSMVDSTLIGFMNGGTDGVVAAHVHDLLDSIRDRIVGNIGGYQADIWEAGFNYMLSEGRKQQRQQQQ